MFLIAEFVPANRSMEFVNNRLPPAIADRFRNSRLVSTLSLAMIITPVEKLELFCLHLRGFVFLVMITVIFSVTDLFLPDDVLTILAAGDHQVCH